MISLDVPGRYLDRQRPWHRSRRRSCKMTPLSFTRRSALRLIAAAFAFRPKIGLSLFEDTDKVNEVHSAVLEHAQRKFEEEHEREKANFKRLVVAGETACMCWHTYSVS